MAKIETGQKKTQLHATCKKNVIYKGPMELKKKKKGWKTNVLMLTSTKRMLSGYININVHERAKKQIRHFT